MMRFLLGLLCVLILGLLVGPFVVPIPALENTAPPKSLADPDSRFLDIASLGGLNVHYKETGEGSPAFLLLHGFGASVFTWREVIGEFGRLGRTVAYDRPAFGLTERPRTWTGENPYGDAAQVTLALGLLEALGIESAVLVANSAGARVAVDVASRHPERVAALILVDPAIFGGPTRLRWLRSVLHTPQLSRLGPLLVRTIAERGDAGIRRAWHDPERITSLVYAGYRKPLSADDWDIALWEFSRADRAARSDRLDALANVPTLLITGDDDRIVPTARTIELATRIPGASLAVLPHCGHLPHEECPVEFMGAVTAFLLQSR